MIGVLCSHSEREAVQEFFQLFKTPWEFYRQGAKYRVVIASRKDTQAIDADLLTLYSSSPTSFDARHEIIVEPSTSGCFPCETGANLPLYGKLASLRGRGKPLVSDRSTGETFALQFIEDGQQRLRVGYDLFQEVEFLLTKGQPVENARIPALDLHISCLREWILGAGIPLVEIPPFPSGHPFIACLTHDVDFAGIRRHRFDRTFWGFVYRALFASLLHLIKGAYPLDRLVKNWKAVLSLPFVYLGLLDDFWAHFDRYAELEKGFSSTFFLIPFKHRGGDHVAGKFSSRRAAPYEITDVQDQVESLRIRGFEIGLHGIDAWHSVEKGRQELNRVAAATAQDSPGVRMHWLCYDGSSPRVLEQAGFDYDATVGYNETIGYKAGTAQVYKPLGVARLLELPLHIQDTALFFPGRLGLTDTQAWDLCENLLDYAVRLGGVLTVSWHERSLAPERLWGEFYQRLLAELQARGAWIGSARQVAQWFRARRSVIFENCSFNGSFVQLRLRRENGCFDPCPIVRVYRPRRADSGEAYAEQSYIDLPYTGESSLEIPLD